MKNESEEESRLEDQHDALQMSRRARVRIRRHVDRAPPGTENIGEAAAINKRVDITWAPELVMSAERMGGDERRWATPIIGRTQHERRAEIQGGGKALSRTQS